MATGFSQADYGAEQLAFEINIVARNCPHRRRSASPGHRATAVRRRAMGPTNKTLSMSPRVEDPGFREITFDFLAGVYHQQAKALVAGGADFILVETIFDTLNAKAAIFAVRQLERELAREFP
jgi:5-methyltetrahydrofolate--homocysteine methyltransferase